MTWRVLLQHRWNGTVFRKRFSRKCPSACCLPSPRRCLRTRAYARSKVGDRFNHFGYALYGLTNGICASEEVVCEVPPCPPLVLLELIIEILKYGRFLPSDICNVRHPETLYQLLENVSAPSIRVESLWNLGLNPQSNIPSNRQSHASHASSECPL